MRTKKNLFLIFLTITKTLTILNTSKYSEELKLEELSKKTQKLKLTHKTQIQISNTSDYESLFPKSIIDEFSKIKDFKKLTVSFSLGADFQTSKLKIENKTLYGFNNIIQNSPKFGSFLTVQCQNSKKSKECAKRAGNLVSGFLGFGGENFISKEYNENFGKKSGDKIYYYGLLQEIFCLNHYHKLKKLYNYISDIEENENFDQEKSDILKKIFNHKIFDNRYASFSFSLDYINSKNFSVEMKISSIFDSKSRIFNFFKTSKTNDIFVFRPKVNQGDNYFVFENFEKKKFSLKIKKKEGENINKLLIRAKDNLSFRENEEDSEKNEIFRTLTTRRFITGRPERPSKVLETEIFYEKNFDEGNTKITLYLNFGYTQRPWISTIKIYDSSKNKFLEKKDYKIDFKLYNHSPKIHLHPRTSLKLTLNQKKIKKNLLRISIEYGVVLHGYEQVEHEQERGVYLPPSMLEIKSFSQNLNRFRIFRSFFESEITDQKRMDHTLVFATLTFGYIFFSLIFTSLAYWGVSGYLDRKDK